ncbi:peptide chain release factor N(5)-glutamine methyltransferase [soil metagenome]
MISTISSLLQQASQQLPQSETAALDIELLLQHILAKSRSYLYTHPQQNLTEQQWNEFQSILLRRQQGEPIAYILGTQEFWSLELVVTSDTLIPRPETELLVELCLQKLVNAPLNIADLGTGSGTIALALAKERPQWQILATDKSSAALQVAAANAKRLELDNINFIVSDWCLSLPHNKKFAAIVSNPPYIASDDPHLKDLYYEPQEALVSGKDGMVALNSIVQQAVNYLLPGGLLLLEHGYNQATAVQKQMQNTGYKHIESLADLAGNMRVTIGMIC